MSIKNIEGNAINIIHLAPLENHEFELDNNSSIKNKSNQQIILAEEINIKKLNSNNLNIPSNENLFVEPNLDPNNGNCSFIKNQVFFSI